MTKTVDANYRFIAAYQEVNARIVQRQQSLTMFVTLVVSLLAALLTLRVPAGMPAPPVDWLILGFPVASMCLALSNYRSERAITNLRSFLSTLEQLGSAHEHLPSYNTEPRWASGANKARRFHDLATTTLAAGANAVGLGSAWKIYPQHFNEFTGFMSLSIALACLSVVLLILTPRWSYQPD